MILHPFQAEALECLRRPSIHLALTAPTGSGKGVILEVLAQDPRERVLVLTPLIALARQQRLRFLAQGVPTGRVRILSPESALLQERAIREWRPTVIAVDEAHCLPEWGGRFRPAYGKILRFIRESGCPRTVWMSATFPRTLLEELHRELPGPWTTLGKFRLPPNLRVQFVRLSAAERIERVRKDIVAREGPGLLFTGTRKEVGRYLGILSGTRAALPYHAGLADEERRLVEAALNRESAEEKNARTSVVATNAFGMGMDFPQFRWTVLSHAPFSLLGLMQAFGRVARGERPGEAVLYWAEEDFRFAGLLLGESEGADQSHRALALFREYLEGDADQRARIETETFL